MADITGTSGHDTLTGTSGIDRLLGLAGDDVLIGGRGADELDGGDDDDTADYSGDFGHIWVDLAAGRGRWNFAHGDTLAGIENVTGTEYDDFLVGAAGANRLRGMGGDDTLDGGVGGDTLDGGTGEDTANYAGEFGGVSIDLATGEGNWNSAEDDVLIAVENVIGTDSTDWLTGNGDANRLESGKGEDRLAGGAGGDVLVGGLGADRLDGGADVDTADYSAAYGGVWIRLNIGAGRWNYAEGDVLTGVENVVGTTFRDRIDGDADGNRIDGGDGNDQLRGLAGDDVLDGGFGSDELDGGAGRDTLDYAGESVGVAINLSTGLGRWNSNSLEVDSLTGIEDVIGTALRDLLSGNGDANRLDGGGGDDRLIGNDGNDTLLGGDGTDLLFGDLGADRLEGGSGVDTVDYSHNSDAVWIDLVTGEGRLNSSAGDVLVGIEKVIGTSFDDRFESGSFTNLFTGGAGNDTFVFRAGFSEDVVTDFDGNGAAAGDTISFHAGIFTGYDDMLAHSSQQGSDVLIQKDAANFLLLQNTQLADLHTSDFIFG